jgi:hypothetical protein
MYYTNLIITKQNIATFPVLSFGTTDDDYSFAQFVLSQNNSVLLKEIKEYSRSMIEPPLSSR